MVNRGRSWHSGIDSEADEEPPMYGSQEFPSGLGTEVQNPQGPNDPGIGPFPTSRHAAVFALGLAASVCFVSSLALVRPFTAAMCAVLTWLCWYVYWLQSERLRLLARVEEMQTEISKASEDPERGEVQKGVSDLDITSCAKAFGMDLDNTVPKDGIYNKVLTITLIKEYLRTLSEVKQYRKHLGVLPQGDDKHSMDLPAAILKGLGLADMPLESSNTRPSLPASKAPGKAQSNHKESICNKKAHVNIANTIEQHIADRGESHSENCGEISGPPSPEQRRAKSGGTTYDAASCQREACTPAVVGKSSSSAAAASGRQMVPEKVEASVCLTPWRQQAAPLPPPSEGPPSRAGSNTPWRQQQSVEISTPPRREDTLTEPPVLSTLQRGSTSATILDGPTSPAADMPWRRSSSSLGDNLTSATSTPAEMPWRRSSSSLVPVPDNAAEQQEEPPAADPPKPVHFGLFGAR